MGCRWTQRLQAVTASINRIHGIHAACAFNTGLLSHEHAAKLLDNSSTFHCPTLLLHSLQPRHVHRPTLSGGSFACRTT